ncbi:MAG: DNA-binding CsgD family transcriptional regulator [Gammaproteobacteria bacterium]|jgi:DNA-binding CsgD family transcriptional regulator
MCLSRQKKILVNFLRVTKITNQLMQSLTEKEIEIFQLLSQGMNTSEISKLLSMSYHDAAEINRRIKDKLKISNIRDL